MGSFNPSWTPASTDLHFCRTHNCWEKPAVPSGSGVRHDHNIRNSFRWDTTLNFASFLPWNAHLDNSMHHSGDVRDTILFSTDAKILCQPLKTVQLMSQWEVSISDHCLCALVTADSSFCGDRNQDAFREYHYREKILLTQGLFRGVSSCPSAKYSCFPMITCGHIARVDIHQSCALLSILSRWRAWSSRAVREVFILSKYSRTRAWGKPGESTDEKEKRSGLT